MMASKNLVIEELLNICNVNEVKQWAGDYGISGISKMRKHELIDSLIHKIKLSDFEVPHLKELCREWKLVGYSSLRKDDIEKLLCNEAKCRMNKKSSHKHNGRQCSTDTAIIVTSSPSPPTSFPYTMPSGRVALCLEHYNAFMRQSQMLALSEQEQKEVDKLTERTLKTL